MRLLIRLFVAFCVATVLAQAIVLAMAAFQGNLTRNASLKALALLNGIDISGERLQKILDEAQKEPVPTYEDVRDAQADKSKNLQMREDAIARQQLQVQQMLEELKAKIKDFDYRKDEFYKLLEDREAALLSESLREVQRTIETLPPEQAKDQLRRMLDSDHIDDVVAIIKEMQPDKRKKILGEFVDEEEASELHEILMKLRAGEPTSGLISEARKTKPQE